MGERTFRRWSRRYEEEGEAGLLDRRIGKASGKRVPVDRCEEVEHLYRTRYQGFTARHFHEHLVRDHRFAWSYSWTKTFLQSRNLLPKAPRRGAHRRKRPRRPLPGMMLHQDCVAARVAGASTAARSVVTMDDATSEIYSALLVEEEGTASTFRALLEVFGRHGLPLSLYTDRGSHYFHTPRWAARWYAASRRRLAARCRIWALRTSRLTRRRPAAARSVCSRPCRIGCRRSWRWRASRRWMQPMPGCAIAIYRRTTRGSRCRHKRARPSRGAWAGPDEVLCVEEERVVGNDNCVFHQTRSCRFRRARCGRAPKGGEVHVYADGSHAVFHGPRCIGRYDEKGALRQPDETKNAA